ncbi:MerR family DNA-binding transcriptional regulator [Amycolatopsis sp. FDAARGOS 1241]|uniref:MerR family DNA-binding transcriptional regulator n=1 Tax=Amycolatopsis sp. FDAARGOS 1241 TaxID=2778070 RepID=UPI001951A568|nr:MerR family DNA-binding transcriptional regulator [Amycolatopsis sp. FDAARGOS 1241]QRP45594.1 MerR family DNA-binding transcriptional regulator [Amycolatopsis sp. FDAARGOS 1241]
MFSIGEFAKLARVSVRMLRHYDALGLLRPARWTRTAGTAPTPPPRSPTPRRGCRGSRRGSG